MGTLTTGRLLRFLTFGALYFAQGVPWGFVATGYVIFLTDLGLDNTAVGAAIGTAYLPWTFKILWGPVVDRFPSARFGRRRHFIIAAELLMGATLLLLLLFDPRQHLSLVAAVLFAHNTAASMQDVAVDALAVDVLPAGERGRANSVMWASKIVGVAVGGGAGTLFARRFGWSALFVLIAIVLWAIMGLVIAVRERPVGAADRPLSDERPLKIAAIAAALYRSFTLPAAAVGLLIAMLTPAGYALVSSVTTRMQRAELKLSDPDIVTLAAVVKPIAGVFGSLVGGLLSDRLGLRKSFGVTMAAIAVTLGAFAVMPHLWPSFPFLVGWTFAYEATVMAYSVATLAFFMTLSNPSVGGTQFAVFMAATNLTYSWTAPVGGYLADRYGFVSLFVVSAVLQLITIPILLFCDPRVAEERFRAAVKSGEVPLPEAGRAPGA